MDQTGSKMALTSASTAQPCAELGLTCITVSEESVNGLAATYERLPAVSSKDAAYILFTSGSTGIPKGLVMDHGALCTSQTAISRRLQLGTETRLLQFSSHTFDISVGEVFTPLLSGGCVVIPSEHDRFNNLAAFIESRNVTHAALTPSFTRSLAAESVPSLQHLIFVGEATHRDVFEAWVGKTRLYNGYGPAETCVFSAIHEWHTPQGSCATIGTAVGGVAWLVEPGNHSQLAPMGTTGEIVIQGPTVLRRYLRDQDNEAGGIVTDLPTWMPHRSQPGWDRMYKTGDLGTYNLDGTINYLGRKDSQTKIRGLRIELGEVEYHIQKTLASARQVAVDVLHVETQVHLVAFVCFSDDTWPSNAINNNAELLLPADEGQLQNDLHSMCGNLSLVLPRYMIPTFFIPCAKMPLNTSGKLNKRVLLSAAGGLSIQRLQLYAMGSVSTEPPRTDSEVRMQSIWAKVLGIPKETIGRGANFLHVGGDSIAAIRLVSTLRQANMVMTVAQIFQDPRLSAMAEKAVVHETLVPGAVKPFSQLDSESRRLVKDGEAHSQCAMDGVQCIVDAYPCTQLQEGLMALSVKQPGSYTAKFVYHIPTSVDLSRFKTAWEITVRQCANLRTRIVILNGRSVQIVTDTGLPWDYGGQPVELSDAMKTIATMKMTYGSPLCRYAICTKNNKLYFLWMVHHAVQDGWSTAMALQSLQSAYIGSSPSPPMEPFSLFIDYAARQNNHDTREFWKRELLGAQRATFPRPLTQNETNFTRALRKPLLMDVGLTSNTAVTKATLIRAAWALVMARYSDTDDICFATTVSGRNAPISGVERMPGPMIATVPLRIRLEPRQSVAEFLQGVHEQALSMVPYEQYGVGNIAKLSKDAREACASSSLLIIQPAQQVPSDGAEHILASDETVEALNSEVLENYVSYPLVMQVLLSGNNVELLCMFNPQVVTEEQLNALTEHMQTALSQLQSANSCIGDIRLSSSWDLRQVQRWHGDLNLTPVHACIHELVATSAKANPAKQALYTSTESMTYKDLDAAAHKLARKLRHLGVGPGRFVPLCVDKSVWAIVGMLGILKAGGAFVAMDPAHPHSRRLEVLRQVDADVSVVSPSTATRCQGLTASVVEVSDELLRGSFFNRPKDVESDVSSSDVAYVLFTSGTTGTPKGIVLSHQALCTSLAGQIRCLGMSAETRMLQFSSYTFDACISEVFGVLMAGGTVCVPDETERLQSTAEFIEASGTNTALLTPSFAKTMDPASVPSLKSLILGGEAVTRDVMEAWVGKVRLFNAYGPTEVCVMSAFHEYQSAHENPLTLGRGVAHANWVVDAGNHDSLAPVGCTGELMVQSTCLATGYVNNPKKTAASFVDKVDWLPGAPFRFYKTGDLVRYQSDGDLEFVGRKDTQIKLRGQRIELGEIEYHLGRLSRDHVVVDYVKAAHVEALVVFMGSSDGSSSPPTFRLLSASDEEVVQFADMVSKLGAVLPEYMVPRHFVRVSGIPRSVSGKVDRNMLKDLVEPLSASEFSQLAVGEQRPFRECTTNTEKWLRAMWSEVLAIPENSISTNDNFYQLGGDSIRIVTLSRDILSRSGVTLGLSLINSSHTTIAAMADYIDGGKVASETTVNLEEEISKALTQVWANHGRADGMRRMPSRASVLLTGATGYLGTEILRQLLRSSSVGSVIALVRAKSAADALERVKRTATLASWWRDGYERKLEVWTGDLAEPRFGLDAAQWARLEGRSHTGCIDAIVHNGAVVHWHADYAKLYDANVASTAHILSASLASPSHPKLVFVSGGVRDTQSDRQAAMIQLGQSMGYVQTKFVAESTVIDSAHRLGSTQNQLSVVKPGRIIGTAETGVANMDDYLWRIVAAAVGMRKYPVEPADSWNQVADVTAVAAAVVGHLLDPGPVTAYHEVVAGLPVAEFWAIVNQELGLAACEPVSWEEWLGLAQVHLQQVGDSHPLWPVQHFLGRLGVPASEAAKISSAESVDRVKDAVKSNVRYLKRIGYFAEGRKAQNGITRTRLG